MGSILIIDPVIPVVTRIKKACKNLNISFLHANSEYNAVNIFIDKMEIIDVVIIDVSMNNLDGFRILNKIRKINKTVKILVLTSLNTRKYFIECLKIGIDDFILKPFENDFLYSRITWALPNFKNEVMTTTGMKLRDYFNQYYSQALETDKKLIVILGSFYKKDEEETLLIDNNDIDEETISFMISSFPNEFILEKHKKHSFIAIVPDLDIKKTQDFLKYMRNLYDIKGIKFIFEDKILPNLENDLVTYNHLIGKLEEKMITNIKFNLANVNNIEDFKK